MKKILGVGITLALILQTSPVFAQTIDYGSLEKLFGEAVTTSATGQPQRVSDVPLSMDIITSEQIRRSGADSIPEILGRLPGVINWQQTRTTADVGIRGQNRPLNPSLLVLVNGRQVYIDSYGFTDWSLIPVQLEEIKQIEVVKGPNTALFGFNAVSGVVNIVTYNPRYDNVGDAGVKVGSDGYKGVHFLDTVSFSDRFHVRASGGIKQVQQYHDISKNTLLPSVLEHDPKIRNFNIDSVLSVTDNTDLRLEATRSDSDGEFNSIYNYFASATKNYSLKGALTSNTDLGVIEASIYQNDYHTDVLNVIKMDNRVTVAQLQDLIQLGTDHTFRLLWEYRHNAMSSPYLFGPGSQISYDVYAASGMWNWRITPKWELTNAIRFDTLALERTGPVVAAIPFTNGNADFDQHVDAFSANSGLVWRATDYDTFHIAFGRGIQSPSLIGMGQWNDRGSEFGIGDPSLDPTIVQNYELGYDRLLPQIGGKFRTALYYKETRDITTPGGNIYDSGGIHYIQTGTIGDSNTKGIEFSLNGSFWEHWSWDTNYAYQQGDDDTIPVGDAQSVDYEHTVPHHIVNVHLGWAKDAWEADIFGQAASHFQAVGEKANFAGFTLYNMDHYYTAGGRLAYIFPHEITLALSGVNISQARVQNNPSLENERQLFLSVSKKF